MSFVVPCLRFVGMIIGAVVGIVVAHPSMNLPAYTGFNNASLGNLFPILFVTAACLLNDD